MKIIKPSVQFFGAVPTDYENVLRFIEMAGRTCYKSEDKITADSAEVFVKRLISAGHLAMVEHSNFVVRLRNYEESRNQKAPDAYGVGKYFNTYADNDFTYIGGNLTAWAQLTSKHPTSAGVIPFRIVYGDLFGWENIYLFSDWQVCPHDEIPAVLHRYSAKFICDRGVSHELVRHRPCSFAQESTRYVDYKDKDMEFIEPAGFDEWSGPLTDAFMEDCQKIEQGYKWYRSMGLTPQQARAKLTNDLKTEIVVTADAAEWAHIKKLRTHPSAHPDMVRVMNMVPWEEMGL